MKLTIPPLDLPTLHTPPSWTNRAGRVDRSACFELRCSRLWRDATYEPAARVARGLETRGRITLIADHLAFLARKRRPTTLRGDRRTTKSNAIQHLHPPSRAEAQRKPGPPSPRHNPLHLPDDWEQAFVIERWRLHDRLAQHFFACPRCGQRALMLLLPRCTADEQRDAHFAAAYLRLYQDELVRRGRFEIRDSLLRRYAPLFPPRPMRCRRCLGVRYGDVPAQRARSKAQQAQLDRVLLTDDQRRALRELDCYRAVFKRHRHEHRAIERTIKNVRSPEPPGETRG